MNKYGNVNRAKQLIELSIQKFMIEKLKIKYYLNSKEFEGYKLIKWLYDNQLLSMKKEIFVNDISLLMLKNCIKSAVRELITKKKKSLIELKKTQLIEEDESKLSFDKSKQSEQLQLNKQNEV